MGAINNVSNVCESLVCLMNDSTTRITIRYIITITRITITIVLNISLFVSHYYMIKRNVMLHATM